MVSQPVLNCILHQKDVCERANRLRTEENAYYLANRSLSQNRNPDRELASAAKAVHVIDRCQPRDADVAVGRWSCLRARTRLKDKKQDHGVVSLWCGVTRIVRGHAWVPRSGRGTGFSMRIESMLRSRLGASCPGRWTPRSVIRHSVLVKFRVVVLETVVSTLFSYPATYPRSLA